MEPDKKENLLLAMLPEGYNYKFVNYELEHNNLEEIKFSLEARINVTEEKGVKVFLSQLSICCSSRCLHESLQFLI